MLFLYIIYRKEASLEHKQYEHRQIPREQGSHLHVLLYYCDYLSSTVVSERGRAMAAGAEHECDNWEIRVTTPAPDLLEPGAGDTARLSPRGGGPGGGGGGGGGGGEVIDTDECWTINIKSPASLNIDTGSPDQDGFAVDT